MKIETEQALLGQEPDMPGLSLLLDEQALLDVVQQQLPTFPASALTTCATSPARAVWPGCGSSMCWAARSTPLPACCPATAPPGRISRDAC